MIQVSAAIITDSEGRILICRRQNSGDCANLWEFPGGKLEKEESPELCVIRECLEELGIRIRTGGLFDQFLYHYPERTIQFYFFQAQIESGDPVCRVHSELKWVCPQDLEPETFCPADVSMVKRLQKHFRAV